VSQADKVGLEERGTIRAGSDTVTRGLLRRASNGAALPALLWSRGGAKGVAVLISPVGKSVMRSASGGASSQVERLLAAGYEVLGVDVLGQGELRTRTATFDRVRLASERAHAGFTFGYNLPLPAQRVQDVLTAIRFARERVAANGRVLVVASGSAAAWAAGARALAASDIDRAVLELQGFRFARVDRIDAPDFLPGAAKYGDVPALLALSSPGAVWILEKTDAARGSLGLVTSAYGAKGAAAQLTIAATGATIDDGIVWAVQ
jgi:hypothetical protein